MTRILDDLAVQLNKDGTRWTLTEELEYDVGDKNSGEKILVPKGFATDFASVPSPGRLLMSTWKKTARAAVVHDFLYDTEGRENYGYSKPQADLIFLEILGVVGHRTRLAAWAAVRAFGRTHWRQDESSGVENSLVTQMTGIQFFWVFLLGLVSILVGLSSLKRMPVLIRNKRASLPGIGIINKIGGIFQIILAIIFGLGGLAVGFMFFKAGISEMTSRPRNED